MSVDFHSKENRFTYTGRDVDPFWENMLLNNAMIKNKTILDLGCGGGIYTKALSQMGAKKVVGLDFSKEMLQTARRYCKDEHNTEFIFGDALATGLDSEQFDLILNRAVIHHMKDLSLLFKEMNRLLTPNGMAVVQDRTLEDCLLPGDKNHIRGYFFEVYPTLVSFERNRRPLLDDIKELLQGSGFEHVRSTLFWEIRKQYSSLSCLEKDLLARTGRSILHELNDKEIKTLTCFIMDQLKNQDGAILEKDRWTVWFANKVG
ncbi:class I SAM-dependent methyltransferase [Sediminibacillus massiliensis]|uniref:class I SAM-dependent methyltransferase n=1 Tax=Sediminibacillus massiliensis TaxID=1926277 RepID=UPI00098886CC|nr:class I SAM-dependent methyltransferase [Sediminibacillus massiliensis]